MPTMMMLGFFLVWPFTANSAPPKPTPAPAAKVSAMPTLPPYPKPDTYENCEKALDQIRKFCEDSLPAYCEERVPKLPKE